MKLGGIHLLLFDQCQPQDSGFAQKGQNPSGKETTSSTSQPTSGHPCLCNQLAVILDIDLVGPAPKVRPRPNHPDLVAKALGRLSQKFFQIFFIVLCLVFGECLWLADLLTTSHRHHLFSSNFVRSPLQLISMYDNTSSPKTKISYLLIFHWTNFGPHFGIPQAIQLLAQGFFLKI